MASVSKYLLRKFACSQLLTMELTSNIVSAAEGKMPSIESGLNEKVENFTSQLKQSKVEGSYSIAHQTVQLLRTVISQAKWGSAKELLSLLTDVGERIVQADPAIYTVPNMVKRVLKLVREEYARAARGTEEGDPQESLQKLLMAQSQHSQEDDLSHSFPSLKTNVMEALQELLSELETSADSIAAQALEHIHSNEVIMTMGCCSTVEAFLKKAADKRKFQVIVVECAPFYKGHKLATSLAKSGIETTVITDSAVFAIMSRVNKVIIGTHVVMANGGLKADNGAHALALAAKHHSVPLIVCAAMFKLSPQYLSSYDQEDFNRFVSPEAVLNFSEGEIISKVQIHNPLYDYVPPDLVTLYISNIGGNAPSYVYRLLTEFYHPSDYDLGQK